MEIRIEKHIEIRGNDGDISRKTEVIGVFPGFGTFYTKNENPITLIPRSRYRTLQIISDEFPKNCFDIRGGEIQPDGRQEEAVYGHIHIEPDGNGFAYIELDKRGSRRGQNNDYVTVEMPIPKGFYPLLEKERSRIDEEIAKDGPSTATSKLVANTHYYLCPDSEPHMLKLMADGRPMVVNDIFLVKDYERTAGLCIQTTETSDGDVFEEGNWYVPYGDTTKDKLKLAFLIKKQRLYIQGSLWSFVRALYEDEMPREQMLAQCRSYAEETSAGEAAAEKIENRGKLTLDEERFLREHHDKYPPRQ